MKKDKQKQDDRTLMEKAEDTLDEVMGTAQDLVYGPQESFTHDIPATMENSNGIRKINKVQTRRNIHKRFFPVNKYAKIVLTVLLVAGVIIGLTYLLEWLLTR